jgi:hypothetical protein
MAPISTTPIINLGFIHFLSLLSAYPPTTAAKRRHGAVGSPECGLVSAGNVMRRESFDFLVLSPAGEYGGLFPMI